MNARPDRQKVVVAAVNAVTTDPGWMSSDRVEALTGGHGMLNIPVITTCNVIATELRRGVSPEVSAFSAYERGSAFVREPGR